MLTSRLVAAGIGAIMLTSCSGGFDPAGAEDIVTKLVSANLLDCDERREPFPEVITCLDPAGDVTIALTNDAEGLAERLDSPGPFLIGPTWIVASFDGDLDLITAFRDTLGAGEIVVRDNR